MRTFHTGVDLAEQRVGRIANVAGLIVKFLEPKYTLAIGMNTSILLYEALFHYVRLV